MIEERPLNLAQNSTKTCSINRFVFRGRDECCVKEVQTVELAGNRCRVRACVSGKRSRARVARTTTIGRFGRGRRNSAVPAHLDAFSSGMAVPVGDNTWTNNRNTPSHCSARTSPETKRCEKNKTAAHKTTRKSDGRNTFPRLYLCFSRRVRRQHIFLYTCEMFPRDLVHAFPIRNTLVAVIALVVVVVQRLDAPPIFSRPLRFSDVFLTRATEVSYPRIFSLLQLSITVTWFTPIRYRIVPNIFFDLSLHTGFPLYFYSTRLVGCRIVVSSPNTFLTT